MPSVTLMKCPACDKQISTAATACPQCGHPFAKATTVSGIDMKDPVHVLGVIVVAIIVVLVIGGSCLALR